MKAPSNGKSEDMSLAKEVVRFLLGRRIEESVSTDGETISFAVARRPGWKLVSIIFSRRALRSLVSDPEKATKLEYLRRDLVRATTLREEYRYPRSLRKRQQQQPPFASLACR
ncbi:MAG TPA: hypothetical protein VMS12_01730 [Thermoanaerobaculia bacterium]|nr:hypothetical protein [Thermoanaerobaculia bacterium]